MATMVGHRTTDQIDFCEVEWRRQKTFHGFQVKPILDKSKVSNVTPVVELRPFTQKEWTRDNSFVGPYEVPNINQSQDNLDNQKMLPQSVQTSLPTTTRQVHVVNLTDQIIPKVNRIHPRVNPRIYIPPNHQNSFTTLGERTRTTLEAMNNENYLEKRNGFSEEIDVKYPVKMIDVCLNGAQMKSEVVKRRLDYLNPLSKYDKCDNRQVLAESTDNSKLNFFKRQHCSSLDVNNFQQTRNTVFHGSDVSSGLPSVELRHKTKASMKQGRVPRVKSARNKHACPRIGGIKSSFQIMIENGPPATIERHLVVELGIRLENVRRHRDNRLHLSPKHKSFHQIAYRSPPTSGEAQLQKGLSMNSSRSQNYVCESEAKTNDHCIGTESKAECHDSGIQSPVDTSDDLADLEDDYGFEKTKAGQLVQPIGAHENPQDMSKVTGESKKV